MGFSPLSPKDKTITNWWLRIRRVVSQNISYCMAAAYLVSTCTELVSDKFSGEERRERDIFI